jgi:hypothetical protein
MPQGSIEFFPQGQPTGSGNELRLPVDALRIVRAETRQDMFGNPYLDVLGEMTNPLPIDLFGLHSAAYLAGMPDSRSEGISLGCRGVVRANDTVPARFTIPLTRGRSAQIVVEHISAYFGTNFVTVPATGVRHVNDHVVATLTNPVETGVQILGICLEVKRGDEIIDAYSHMFGPYLEAGEAVEWTSFEELPQVPGTAVEITAYAQAALPPILGPPDY